MKSSDVAVGLAAWFAHLEFCASLVAVLSEGAMERHVGEVFVEDSPRRFYSAFSLH